MPLKGDWDGLRRTIGELGSVRGLQGPITEAAEAGVEGQYTADFADQRDPWGKGWAPTQTGKTPVLVGPTLALANPTVTSSRLTVRVKPVSYWVFHQMGANGMAERSVLPFQDGSLWDRPIQSAIEDTIIEHFGSAK